MTSLQLFPSRTVSMYMGRMFLIRTFAILAALVLVLQALDLLGESGKILAYAGNGDAEVFGLPRSLPASCPSRYCSARSSR